MHESAGPQAGARDVVMRGLAARIGIAFVLALLLLQCVIAAALVWPDDRPALFRLVAPDEAAAIARALESAATPEERALIVRALNHGRLSVSLRDGFPPPHVDDAPYLSRLFSRHEGELEGRPYRIARRHGDAMGEGNGLQLMVGLRNGQVLVLEGRPVLLQRLGERLLVVGAATAIILLLVMIYCVRQIALPARRLAHAARGLAADIDMPDLPARGAAEIAMLSRAFNDMKRTIRGLMQERTRVLAAIAHDLRTYLTRLRLRADFIEDVDQRQRAIRDLDEMGWLLDDTLTFAHETTRPSAPSGAVIDAGDELRRFVAMRREIGDSVKLACLDEPLPAVRCAPLALRRMLSNLTDNAIRYGQCARLRAKEEAGQVLIVVEDEGPGVPPDQLSRLARPFERGEPSRGRQTGGTGLGLAIVKALAHSQGGELTIENRVEGGLRATVSLSAVTLHQ